MRVIPDKKYLVTGDKVDYDRPVVDAKVDKLSKSAIHKNCVPVIDNYTRYFEPVRLSLSVKKAIKDNGLKFEVNRYLIKAPAIWNPDNSITRDAKDLKSSVLKLLSLIVTDRDSFFNREPRHLGHDFILINCSIQSLI